MIVSGFEEELVICKHSFTGDLELEPEYLQRVVQNYSNFVGLIPWKFSLNFSTLVRFANLIPVDFFSKLPGIARISTNFLQLDPYELTESEQSNLIELIKRSRTRSLFTNNLILQKGGSLSSFYKQISTCESIQQLTMGKFLEGVEFEHFLKLKNLNYLEIEFDKIPIGFVSRLFDELKLLYHLRYYSMSKNFRLRINFEIGLGSDEDELEPEEKEFPYYLYFYSPLVNAQNRPVHKRFKNRNELAGEIAKMKENKIVRDFLLKERESLCV